MPIIRMEFETAKPTVVTVIGAQGPVCRELSKPFLDRLGGKLIEDKPTAEMQQVSVSQNQGIKIGQ